MGKITQYQSQWRSLYKLKGEDMEALTFFCAGKITPLLHLRGITILLLILVT